MVLAAIVGWISTTLLALVVWRLVHRLRVIRSAGLAALSEAYAWRDRAAAAEHELRLVRAGAEGVRQSYARVIGLARGYRTGGYPE